MKKNVFILFFFVFFGIADGQTLYPFGFEQDFSVTVLDSSSDTLDFAWWGGLNGVQFSQIDINLDGIDDLLILDRSGDRLLPLINQNVTGEFSYTYAPEYRIYFPQDLHDWIILIDFNHDGKQDIFSYSVGGIRVYENTSTSTELSFTLWSNLLNSLQYSSYINIYLTNVDYPIISDIDNDGDVDILTFFGLGSFVEWHRNMGVELHSNPDTMDFQRTYRCWGNFAESESSNSVSLNITCPWTKMISEDDFLSDKEVLHVGSTMLFHDIDGDGLKDLLIGDTDFPNLIFLKNGGTVDSAHFISQELYFPTGTQGVDLFSIPVPAIIDINNDGVNEFIVSAFDPSPIISETKNSIWLYENVGSNDSLDLNLVQENFIQDRMIEHGSGAYPVFADYDGDGLMDLFVGNFGNRDSSYYEFGYLYSVFTSSISVYVNIGSATQPVFQLAEEDFAGLSSLGLQALYPAFADLDNDGDVDMVCGNINGTLIRFTNTAGAGNVMNMVLTDSTWLSIDVGQYSAPVLFDLTKNGLPDLIVGQRMGYLSYWQNTGTASVPVFTHITDTLGDVYTSDLTHSYYGHSIPFFYRNALNETFLFTGSHRGWLLLYDDIDDNLSGAFHLVDTLFVAQNSDKVKIVEGMRVSPAVFDLDLDGFPELLVGNYCGGISFFKGVSPPPDTVGIHHTELSLYQCTVFPNPFHDRFSIQIPTELSSLSVMIYSLQGKLMYLESFYAINKEVTIYPDLPKGMYILHVSSPNKNQSFSAYFKIVNY